MRKALLLATAVLALAPAGAGAAIPFTVGQGMHPHLAFAASGTAHVVWADGNLVRHCRLPPGAVACATESDLDVGAPADAPFVLPDGPSLYLVMPHTADHRTYLWRSGDDGLTWGPRETIYAWAGDEEPAEPFLGPRPGEVTLAAFAEEATVWSAALDGTEAAATAHTTLTQGGRTTIAPTGDGGVVATVERRFYSVVSVQHMAPGGDPSDPGAWSPRTRIGRGVNAVVAGGPGGVHLASTNFTTNSGELDTWFLELRRWDGAAFGAPRQIARYPGDHRDLLAAPSGALAAVYPSSEALEFLLTRDEGRTTTEVPLAFERTKFPSPDIALRPDDTGFAVYVGHDTFDRQSVDEDGPGLIRVADTEPEEFLRFPRSLIARIGRARIELGGDGPCAYYDKPYVINADLLSRKRHGRFRRIARLDAELDGEPAGTDSRRPFRVRLPIKDLTLGQIYTWHATMTVALEGGRRVTRSSSSRFRVC